MGQFSMEISGCAGSALSGNQQMKDGQYEVLDGAAVRVLLDNEDESPIEP
ncbi:cbb3-type cytochrome oxidase assembly protein CcoS [Pseudorhizobium halotolerans]|jgi:hypothetical protein|uniref:Cbb3-type cytochrome oxidase assembly protein CcoS n=1 Tax=Pseudorhizobium halotolerans TaxID=1233081 RepID=A0ABM8PJ79_9HYPH|nr:hypothetical protein [Pseudorhizobium halotolerans]CAD7033072.1 cbb3-type cytochrome oxidase assembly protein CcoS [Pseudorhizobium halotolerans]